jgi:serine/threonine-protein kinase
MEPARIGPYRLLGRLGAGGMGEVYDAWDERLDRRVAVKRIRPISGDPADSDASRRRERFRFEARAVARLSHPAIVQIYDLVEAEDGDWIVLEHVPGPTLAALLAQGPLDLARLLPLAREIALGLAEAHGKGLLHRDLKTENVIVTPSGHAKILDFGLAKAFWPLPGTPSGDAALSVEGTLAGTSRALSPEQVRGLPLDPRSDLFSFGILLYETLTGTSPFAAPGTEPATILHRILTHQPPPAAELAPAVPVDLSLLVDQLLEKDRERRPATAAEVAARLADLEERLEGSGARRRSEPFASAPTLVGVPSPAPVRKRRGGAVLLALLGLLVLAVIVGLALWFRGPGREHRGAPLYVAVPPPEVGLGHGQPEVELAAAGVQSALLRGLVSLQGLAPLAPEAAGGSSRGLAVDETLVARLDCREQACNLALSRRAAGRLSWVETFEVPLDDFRLLATAVAAALRRGYPGFPLRDGVPELAVASEDYARYLRLAADRVSPIDGRLARAEALRRGSPRFLEAYLLESDLLRTRFFNAREPADLERALDLLRQARSLAPGDPRPAQKLFELALAADRLDEAEAALADLDRLAPGEAETLAWRAILLERRGHPKEALASLRTAAGRHPSKKLLLSLANLETRQGESKAAGSTLKNLLARYPGDFFGRSLLAQLELLEGSPERAAALYGELARETPDFPTLSNLGLADLLLDRYAEAAAHFEGAAALAPSNAVALLNLADARRLAGKLPESEALYRKVLDLAQRDPAAADWQPLSVRAQALAHLGQDREAVAAIQKALEVAPHNPQLAYEASLVYAVVGDSASAAVNAERALASGVAPRWFGFPWFDRLRADSALAVRLRRP